MHFFHCIRLPRMLLWMQLDSISRAYGDEMDLPRSSAIESEGMKHSKAL